MSLVLRIHLTLSVVVFGIVFFSAGQMPAFAIAAGAGVSFLNLVALNISWPQILRKKQVAPAVVTIVFKFLILGWILYAAVFTAHLSIGWMALGLALVFPSLVATSFLQANPEPNSET
jgi:hypothetical protein